MTKLVFGGQDDLQLYHDGSNSFIVDGGAGSYILDLMQSTLNLQWEKKWVYLAKMDR